MQRLAVGLVILLLASLAHARDKASATLPRGTPVGVVNLLDAELMHYHAARQSKDSFLKIQAVGWSVDSMLNEVTHGLLQQMGLKAVPLAPTDAVKRSRESCFVDASLSKGLPRACAAPLVELAAAAGVNFLLLLTPALNNAAHADGNPVEAPSESLRGWAFFTRERGVQDRPALYTETELLLVAIGPEGASLRARKWGGTYSLQWQTYTPPPDPRLIPPEQLDQLQPLFAAMLSRQAKDMLEQVRVEP